jgi:hypothetical protein
LIFVAAGYYDLIMVRIENIMDTSMEKFYFKYKLGAREIPDGDFFIQAGNSNKFEVCEFLEVYYWIFDVAL